MSRSLSSSQRLFPSQLRGRVAGAVLLAAALAASATFGMSAWAHGHGHGGHGGTSMMGMLAGKPERVDRMVNRMLEGLDATEAQRSQIQQIARAAAADLQAQRESRRALQARSLEIFTAPTVDAQAAEQLRQQMLAQHDQASRRMTAALLDISRVLTSEQRVKVAERMKQHAQRMQEHRKGRATQGGPSNP